jgi:hypothetical protein
MKNIQFILAITLFLIGLGIAVLNPYPPLPVDAQDSSFTWDQPFIFVRLVAILVMVIGVVIARSGVLGYNNDHR